MLQKYHKSGIIASIILVSFSVMILNAGAESNTIPDWVKNIATWWGEDQISDEEYVKTLQYLVNENILTVNTPPISSVFATDVNISDERRAQSFMVSFQSEHYDFDETYYTFIQFFNRNEATGTPRGILAGIPDNPQFILGSLPSDDKHQLYEYIGKTLEPGAQLELLELSIHVSVITGNGESLQTWEYEECTLLDYVVFLDSNKEEFRWSQIEDKEIRELFVFQCQGLDFTI